MLFPDLPIVPTTITDTLDLTKCNNSKEGTTIPKTITIPETTTIPAETIAIPAETITIPETVWVPETNDDFNKENIQKINTFKKKTSAKKRLDRSLDSVNALKETLEEKNKYKKIFYENYIIEMRRQTDALLLIANNLRKE